jgi:ribokinase
VRRVVVLGTAVIDVIGYAPRQPRRGETVVGNGYEVAPGGKGLNQAIAAARAGASSALVAGVGADDFGNQVRRVLADESVDQSAVLVNPDLPTGVGLPIVSEDGDNSIVIVPGASNAIGPLHEQWLLENLGVESVFLSQLELPIDVVARNLRIAEEMGAMVVLNPAPAADISELIGFTDVLVPNQVEAEGLTGISDPRAAARRMSTWSDEMAVIVTCGADGAVVACEGDLTEITAPRIMAVDTVGAGDVFCGYLAAEIASGVGVVDAATQAVRAASMSVMKKGAAMSAPRRTELAAQPCT